MDKAPSWFLCSVYCTLVYRRECRIDFAITDLAMTALYAPWNASCDKSASPIEPIGDSTRSWNTRCFGEDPARMHMWPPGILVTKWNQMVFVLQQEVVAWVLLCDV